MPVSNGCNRKHTGECLEATNKCFGCGETGQVQQKRYCPKRNNAGQVQLGAVNAKDAGRKNLVKGMIKVSVVPTILLFDS